MEKRIQRPFIISIRLSDDEYNELLNQVEISKKNNPTIHSLSSFVRYKCLESDDISLSSDIYFELRKIKTALMLALKRERNLPSEKNKEELISILQNAIPILVRLMDELKKINNVNGNNVSESDTKKRL
jgi:hypothetical protein